MSFTKPYTYTTGAVLDASNQRANDDAAKIYINQGAVLTDIVDESLNTDNFAKGEYNPINGSHQFVNGEIFGRFNNAEDLSRSYYTSNTKANSQTGANSVQYQDIFETGDRVVLEYPGFVFVSFSCLFKDRENDVEPAGRWESEVYLKVVNESTNTITYEAATLAYHFEESNAGPSGAVDPGGTFLMCRRIVGFQKVLNNLSAGTYRISAVTNPRVEQGFAESRSFSLEIFY